ncbi:MULTISPECIES: hypothetical protein [Streptomyces]|uniref:hypothetical protein n=1 Tax=Streptomyces TaxID=1883 RepID=UPI0022AAD8FA|nr:hypothetical protein [Streptomyces sp. HB2AG]MCZ2526222.1 hypothetical protein [Streptomyces sp. HB2AG]
MSEFEVDLSELDNVVRQLRNVQKDMGSSASKAKYATVLPEGSLGNKDFHEAQELHGAHDKMQGYLTSALNALQNFIEEFGDKTDKTRGAYEDAEYATQSAMKGI